MKKVLKKKADKLFSEYIRKRDGRCMKCSRTSNLQCAHIIGRRNLKLRYDENNAITLCIACHLYWAHKEPLDFTAWLNKKFPEKVKYLNENRNDIEKIDYAEKINHLKILINKL